MKRGWIALLMIALSLICGGTEYFYVTSNAGVYIRMLDDADEKMERGQIKDAESAVRRLDHRFGGDLSTLEIFAHHNGADSISGDLAMLCRLAQTGRAEEFLAVSAKAKREISALRDSETLSWGNIF